MRKRHPGLLLLIGVLIGVPALDAQNPPSRPPAPVVQDTARRPAPQDTAGAPRARPDTTQLPDSLSPDSFRAELPPLGAPPGPLPKAGRTVFDRDALWFSGAATLGELLERVPGVFLVRGGWYGREEVVHYAGQGAGSVEVFWDGYALDPMGSDSTGLDLSTINLGLLQRVEVEVLPSVLRVYLFSDGQTIRKPRTETSFATGDASTNTYRIRYLNRWKNGTGLGLGVNFLGTSGVNTSPGKSNDLTLWAKGSWIPDPRYGVQYQVVSVSMSRDSIQLDNTVGSPLEAFLPQHKVHRTDAFLRGFIASRADGMGLRFDAIAGSSSYTDTTPALGREELQGSAILGYRAERWSSEATVRVRDTRTPFEVRLRGAVSPFAPLTLTGYWIARTHLSGRRSSESTIQAELRPLPFVAIHGAFRSRSAVAAPAVLTDTAQSVQDVTAGVTVTTRPLDLDLSYARHGAFAAPLYGSFGPLVPGYTSFAVKTATAAFALRPTRYLTLSGWYRQPLVTGTAELGTSTYEPPHHSRLWATFRTRLLPVLRRGAFDFTAEVGMEGWSRGAYGADTLGNPLLLKGATVVDWRLEMRLLGAALFWSFANAQAERYSILPGLSMPRAKQRYGVRWEFTN